MKIEILYPEICNLYGDTGNVLYLKRTLKDATFIETALNEEPDFIKNKIDIVYLGSCSESHQELMIEKLMPFKDKIKEAIENDTLILATGNSFEIFGNYIQNEDESKIDCLNIFNSYAIRDRRHRHNSLFWGKYDEINIVGFKSQFAQSYTEDYHFIEVVRGIGSNPESEFEGIHYRNFFGTYLLGPILIINPDFTKYLLNKAGYTGKLAFEEESYDAYEFRLKELKDPKTKVVPNH